jgi:hypothetical protein
MLLRAWPSLPIGFPGMVAILADIRITDEQKPAPLHHDQMCSSRFDLGFDNIHGSFADQILIL